MNAHAANSVPSLARIARRMVGGLARSPYAAYRMCVRDIRAQYAKSIFGLVWEFVDPIVIAVLFIYLRRFRVIDIPGIEIPYALYVVTGILVWQSFAESVTLSLGSIQRMSGLLGQVRVAPEVIMLSTAFRVLFNSFFRWLVILGVAAWFGFATPLSVGAFLLAFPSIILAGFALGFLLAPFSIISTDIATAVRIGLRPLMFLSAALFPLPETGVLSVFAVANPAAVFIENLRSLLIAGSLAEPGLFWGMLVGAGALFLFAWYVYHVCLRLVAGHT